MLNCMIIFFLFHISLESKNCYNNLGISCSIFLNFAYSHKFNYTSINFLNFRSIHYATNVGKIVMFCRSMRIPIIDVITTTTPALIMNNIGDGIFSISMGIKTRSQIKDIMLITIRNLPYICNTRSSDADEESKYPSTNATFSASSISSSSTSRKCGL